MKIIVVGIGYVGLSNAVLLSRTCDVIAIDTDVNKVSLVNSRISPIQDREVEKIFNSNESISLFADTSGEKYYSEADYVIISTPTNYNEVDNYFDTSSVESVIDNILMSDNKPIIIIKSTIPIGFTERIKSEKQYSEIYFSPEFLREGNALYDNLYPSRIVVGGYSDAAIKFGEILNNASIKKDNDIVYCSNTEAETIKLFANSYLAMRVSYFNELDTFCSTIGLDSSSVIKGVSLDPRIGDYYNNPSFGYGGYCLPKDTKQLLSNFKGIPQKIIGAIVESNEIRKNFIANDVLQTNPGKVGVYKLSMKSNSDNYRSAAIFDVINILLDQGVVINIFEPTMSVEEFRKVFDNSNINYIRDFDKFTLESDVIIANRIDDYLMEVKDKVYSRDVYKRD